MKSFSLCLFFVSVVSIGLISCNDDAPSTKDDMVDTNTPTFQFVKFNDGDVDVTFYESTHTVKQVSGPYDTKMVLRMELDNYPNTELSIEVANTEDGDYTVHDKRSAGTIVITGKGFTSEGDEFTIRPQKGPGDSNCESARFYTKDGKSVLEIINADFESPNSSLMGALSLTLIWE